MPSASGRTPGSSLSTSTRNRELPQQAQLDMGTRMVRRAVRGPPRRGPPMRPKLTVCAGIGLLMVLAFEARAADPPNPPKQREGRGFVVGMSLGPTRSRFSGAEDLALVFGDVVGTIPLCCVGGTTLDVRFGQLVPRSLLPANPEHVVPLPSSQDGVTVSLQIGWSASRRLGLDRKSVVEGKGIGGWRTWQA